MALLQGKPILAHVVDRLAPQCGYLAINAKDDPKYQPFGIPVVEDILAGQPGPLAGIHAAMIWARALGYDRVLTTGNDTPFLPTDWVDKLADTDKSIVAISSCGDRDHFIHAIWPTSLAEQAEIDVQNGLCEVGKWLKKRSFQSIEFPIENEIDPFFNINSKDDLKRAEKIMEEAIRP